MLLGQCPPTMPGFLPHPAADRPSVGHSQDLARCRAPVGGVSLGAPAPDLAPRELLHWLGLVLELEVPGLGATHKARKQEGW